MQHNTTKRHSTFRRRILASTAIATIAQFGVNSYAGSTPGEVTISTSGSTALKNWFTASTGDFTDLDPGTTINIGGTTYPIADAGNNYNSSAEWNTTSVYQLAPKANTTSQGQIADTAAAVRLEYHESGSVEGILELANDQIGQVQYVTQNVNRDPLSTSVGGNGTVYGGNAVWVNYTNFGGKGGTTWSASTGGTSGGTNPSVLGNFYNQSGYTSSSPNVFSLGGSAQPDFNASGGNLFGGQNAVQLALSDAIPVQVFANDNTTVSSTAPWTATPQTAGYGQGNTKLPLATLGTPGLRATYQSAGALNMSAGTVNPRSTTGATFGMGPWNNAELNNLTSTTIASTATLFVANPGTGLTQLDRTDAQWLQTTGRLANGAAFQMTTRDVNSGTRDVAALTTGIDPTWAVGKNDDGNGNANDGGTDQVTIGPGLRFSNKTAGGNELRPTVQSARMAIGTLSINDAAGNTVNSAANPIRALAFSDSADGSAPYVQASYWTVAGVNTSTGTNSYGGTYTSANPSGLRYAITQNEQAVTLKAPGSTYNTANQAIQGDDSYGDVQALLNNTYNSVSAAFQTSSGNSIQASPITGLMSNGYIPPQLMAMNIAQNGLTNVSNSAPFVNTNYNNSNFQPSNSQGFQALQNLVNKLAQGNPSTVTSGNSTSVYGGNTLVAAGVTSANGYGGVGFSSQIPLTTLSNAYGATAGGNWLFGNFNQNGVRDYDAVIVEAQKAQAALESGSNPLGDSAFTGTGQQINSTTLSSAGVVTGVAALDSLTTLTKGDLIAMGDYNGDGKFDGADLYDMAIGASLTSSGSYRPTESGNTFTTGTMNATSGTFATSVTTSVLNKNVALDYLQANATSKQKAEAAEILTVGVNSSTGVANAVPLGATVTGTDVVSGLAQFTFDPSGTNAYNKSDVNQDGVVDFNDALAVDALNGQDYTNMSNALTATEPTPVTGAPELANLVLATQYDVNADGSAHTVVNAQDLAVVDSALTGSGTTNWYGYTANKSGPGLIAFNRSSSVVNVYSGASLSINSGTVQILSAIDPFTEANPAVGASNNPAGTYDTSKSVAITISGGKLEYSGGNNPAASGIQVQRLSSLNISSGSVVIDPAASHLNRTVLVTGSFTNSALLDLGNSDLIVQGGNLTSIFNQLHAGYNGGNWNGSSGIASAAATADNSHLTALGEIQSPGGTFDGVTTTPSDVLVKYTYYGDTNLDGTVDGSDYSRIDYAFAHGGLTGWANGDFNYDGVIDGSDYTLMDNAFNSQGIALSAATVDPTVNIAAEIAGASSVASPSAVPEPASLGLLGLGVMGLLGRRRKA